MRFGTRELFFVMLLVAMPLSAYYFVFAPWNRQIAQARNEVHGKEAKLQQLQLATANIKDLGHEIDQLSKAINVFEKKLPAQRQVEVVLKEVWQLAAKHGLNPKSVRTDRIVPTAHYAELPIRMEIVGNFDGFYGFLLDLEKLPRITRMPTMHLSKVVGPGADGQIKANIVLSIFFEGQHHQRGGQSG